MQGICHKDSKMKEVQGPWLAHRLQEAWTETCNQGSSLLVKHKRAYRPHFLPWMWNVKIAFPVDQGCKLINLGVLNSKYILHALPISFAEMQNPHVHVNNMFMDSCDINFHPLVSVCIPAISQGWNFDANRMVASKYSSQTSA